MMKKIKQNKEKMTIEQKKRFEEIVANQEKFEGLVKKTTCNPEKDKIKKRGGNLEE